MRAIDHQRDIALGVRLRLGAARRAPITAPPAALHQRSITRQHGRMSSTMPTAAPISKFAGRRLLVGVVAQHIELAADHAWRCPKSVDQREHMKPVDHRTSGPASHGPEMRDFSCRRSGPLEARGEASPSRRDRASGSSRTPRTMMPFVP